MRKSIKSTKFLLGILVILIFLLIVWLWADGLQENKSLSNDIGLLNIQIEDLINNNAELLADAKKETERANKAELERNETLMAIEKLKKQAPKPHKIPSICLPDATTRGVNDIGSIISLLCGEIGLRDRSIAFHVNLNLEYEKALAAGTETIKGLRIANHDYARAISNFESLKELQQKKFDLLLKKEKKKKYRWGAWGVLLGAAIGFSLK